MGPGRAAMLLMLAAGWACSQHAGAQTAGPSQAPAAASAAMPETGSGKRILLPPTLQWDAAMLAFRAALQQTTSDFAILTGGLAFGMSPAALNAKLAEPYAGVSWTGLSLANEFPGEARMFGVPFATAGVLRMDATACTGASSFVVFLFKANGLFRISYRLTADKGCPDTDAAAHQIYARYVPFGRSVAFSVRYKTGRTQVIDITDPASNTLVPVRWRQAAN
jgi:hypothetical protein